MAAIGTLPCVAGSLDPFERREFDGCDKILQVHQDAYNVIRQNGCSVRVGAHSHRLQHYFMNLHQSDSVERPLKHVLDGGAHVVALYPHGDIVADMEMNKHVINSM